MKMARLELDYERTLAAEGTSGVTGQPLPDDKSEDQPDNTSQKSGDETQEQKDQKFGLLDNQSESSDDGSFGDFQEGYQQLDDDNSDPGCASDPDEDDGLNEDNKDETPAEPRMAIPETYKMSEEHSQKIKSAMGKLKLTPPPWAKAIDEQQWMNAMFNKVAAANQKAK